MTDENTPEEGAEIAYAPGEPDWRDADSDAADEIKAFEPTPEGYEALELVAARKDVQESNQKKVQLFERLGVNIAPALLGCRLEVLITWAVGGEDTQQRKDFDAEFEQALAPLLDTIAEQVKQEMARRDAEAGAKLISSGGQPLRSV